MGVIINSRPKCQNCKEFMDRLLKNQVEELKKENESLKEITKKADRVIKSNNELYKLLFELFNIEEKKDIENKTYYTASINNKQIVGGGSQPLEAVAELFENIEEFLKYIEEKDKK